MFFYASLLIGVHMMVIYHADHAMAKSANSVTENRPSDYFQDRYGSMRYFFRALGDVEANRRKRPVRILYFGTSNNGYDRVGSALRNALQKEFQDGGKGYVPITKHWKHLRHRDIKWTSKGFSSLVVTKDDDGDGRYGLAGILAIGKISAQVEYQTIPEKRVFAPGTRFSKFSIYYRNMPSGGSFNIEADNRSLATISTRGDDTDKIASFSLKDSGHRLKIATSGTVHMYGVTFERDTGIVVDSLPYVGSHIDHLKNFDKAHIKKQLMFRKPDLLMLQFGENEAVHSMTNTEIKKLENDYVENVLMFRKGYPKSSCLIISIKDIGNPKIASQATHESVPKIVSATRKVALRTKCAFLDLYEKLGGSGTMKKWRALKSPLVSKDLGHLLDRGAIKVGETIAEIIIEEYRKSP